MAAGRGSWQLEQSKCQSHLQERQDRGLGSYRSVSLPSTPEKVMEQIILETLSKHITDRKVTGSSQLEFVKTKMCLTNLIAFYNETDLFSGWGDDIYLDFSKAFDSISCNVLTDKRNEVWTMLSGQWSGLKTSWIVSPRRFSSTTQSPGGGQPLAVSGSSQYWGSQWFTSSLIPGWWDTILSVTAGSMYPTTLNTPSRCQFALMQVVFHTCDHKHTIPFLPSQHFLRCLWSQAPKFWKLSSLR